MKWKNLLPLRAFSRLWRGTSSTQAPFVNRREFTRVPLSLAADVLSEDILVLSGRTRDLSVKGLYLLSDKSLPVGMACRIALQLSGREPAASLSPLMPTIQLDGKVVRVTESGLGIEFHEIIGQESFECLHRLLWHHSRAAQAPEHVRQELERAAWAQTTRIVRPFADGSLLLATRFSLKRDRKKADTEIEFSPGCVILLGASLRKPPRRD
jgi:hypothetical protein